MSQSVAEFMLDRLRREWDVSRIYGYPGDGINSVRVYAHAQEGEAR